MRPAESLRGALERRFIQELVLAIARSSSEEERQRHLRALRELLASADPTLDATLLDPWTRAYLARAELRFGHMSEPVALYPEAHLP